MNSHPFRQVLQGREPAEIAEWLNKYLLGLPVRPDIPLPHDFRDRATYLITWLGSAKDVFAAKQFGDAALEVLRQCLSRGQVLPPTGNSELLTLLLVLLEGLPCSAPEEATKVLNGLRLSGKYKRWPSEQQDCHRLILLAMANQLRIESDSLRGWEFDFARELLNPDYTAAAYSVLLQLSPQSAIEHLPTALKVLKDAEISPRNVLFGLAHRLGANQEPWLTLRQNLRRTGLLDAAGELSQIIRNLGFDSIVPVFTQSAYGGEASEDPQWKRIRTLSDLSTDDRTLRALWEEYGQNGSIEFSPECPLLVDYSGAIRFTIESFCKFAIRLAPRIKWALQVVHYPRDYEDQDFLNYATAILAHDGWLGYVIADPDAQARFDQWKRVRVASELRKQFMKILDAHDPKDGRVTDRVKIALERLLCLPAHSPPLFQANHLFLALENDEIIGAFARRNEEKRTAYIFTMTFMDAHTNCRVLKQDIEAAVRWHSERPIFKDSVLAAARWLVGAGISEGSLLDDVERNISHPSAALPKLEEIPQPARDMGDAGTLPNVEQASKWKM